MMKFIPFVKSGPVVSVIRLNGVIASGGRGALNHAAMRPVIEKAFKKGKPDAVALVINSPGGSPVQSSLIAAHIRDMAREKRTPVFAFVEDVAASGGYWLATAADEIYADHSSVLGSIGVISAGFGFQGAMEQHGIERRVHTAGTSKSMLDPFRAEKPADVKRLKTVLEQIHDSFKNQVTLRRAGKLPADRDLFNGDIWIGQAAVDVGLIDGIGHMAQVMKERFGDKVKFARYGVKKPFLSRFGANIVNDALDGIEARAHYARFGL
jgi:serine protease SohB